jgi:hypothetical protein
MTPDTSGLTSETISKQYDLFDASSKTLRDISVSASEKSLKTWKALVTQRRGEYLARLKSAHRIRENESTLWPTPTAHNSKEGAFPSEYNRNTPTLTSVATQKDNKPASSGSLNPDWVEWLMGVPTKWTDLGSWGTG